MAEPAIRGDLEAYGDIWRTDEIQTASMVSSTSMTTAPDVSRRRPPAWISFAQKEAAAGASSLSYCPRSTSIGAPFWYVTYP